MVSELKYSKDYFEKLRLSEIDILIVGRDPYPSSSNEIPFSKDSLEKIKETNCSGQYLLMGLGVDVFSNEFQEKTPNQIFFDLVEKGIGVANSCYYYFGKGNPSKEEIADSEERNLILFRKAKHIVTFNQAIEKVLKKYSSPPAKYIKICHPDFRNKISSNEPIRNQHKEIWQELNGLKKYIESGKWREK